MSTILLLLQKVHVCVHDLPMKPIFSEPTLYTGGVDIKHWNKLTNKEKEEAISKDWYVYFSFRNPKTDKMERQQNIKLGVNKFKTKEERMEILKSIQENLLFLLRKGFNPYQDNTHLENKLFKQSEPEKDLEPSNSVTALEKPEVQIPAVKEEHIEKELTIREAFYFGLNVKKNVLSKTSYSGFQGRINRFLNWLDSNGNSSDKISTLNKKIIVSYLNHVLENTSATNRNNTRTDLSALIQALVDNEIMADNFIKNINVLKASPERNKTYSKDQETDILNYLEENDPILLLYIQFISYNFLRPIEVNRLKVGDLNIVEKVITVDTKTKKGKTKLLPQKMIDLLPDLTHKNPDHFLFTPTQMGGEWNSEDTHRRNYFSKRFKAVKEHFGLGIKYGLYSFRHTAITNLYKELCKTMTSFEAKSRLLEITGHRTMEALEKYLRGVDAELPKDYSDLL